MKTKSRTWRFQRPIPDAVIVISSLTMSLMMPAKAPADGCFVAPPFVWNKYKDINEPTQKAIIVWDAGREDLILQVKYDGPVEEFGWLIPVPGLPTVQKGSMRCFYELSRYTQEHFEPRFQGVPAASWGDGEGKKPEPVKVIQVKTVGTYEVAVLSAKDAGALGSWLKTNGFALPKDKAGVIDTYIRQQWHFVAAKINLGKGVGFRLANAMPKQAPTSAASVKAKLAKGELHPLQISFDSAKCVFPLRISSLNGWPSEVQIYVLSREPLVEEGLYEKNLPELHRQRVEVQAKRAICERNLRAMSAALLMYSQAGVGGGAGEFDPVVEEDHRLSRGSDFDYGELTPYGLVSDKELPACGALFPRLKGKSWWLTKKTWTFKPEEMRDLEFQPAIAVFTGLLADVEGDFVAANLARLGTNAVPTLLAALRNGKPSVRAHAASTVGQIQDERLLEPLPAMLKDSQPEVRFHAASLAVNRWKPEFTEAFAVLLQDEYADIRRGAVRGLASHSKDAMKFTPAYQRMLKDKNPDIQFSGLMMLTSLSTPIPREDLLALFSVPRMNVVSLASDQLRDKKVTSDEAVPLLSNPMMLARMIGLKILRQNADKRAAELTLPLLNDREARVRASAGKLLQDLTGQNFPVNQPEQWEKWWTANKATFVPKPIPQSHDQSPGSFRLDTTSGDLQPVPAPTLPPDWRPKP